METIVSDALVQSYLKEQDPEALAGMIAQLLQYAQCALNRICKPCDWLGRDDLEQLATGMLSESRYQYQEQIDDGELEASAIDWLVWLQEKLPEAIRREAGYRFSQGMDEPLVWARKQPEMQRVIRIVASRYHLSRDDLAQELLMGAISSRGSFQPEKPFFSWLRGILNNRACTLTRKGRRERQMAEGAEEWLSTEVAPDHKIKAQEEAMSVRQALASLNNVERLFYALTFSPELLAEEENKGVHIKRPQIPAYEETKQFLGAEATEQAFRNRFPRGMIPNDAMSPSTLSSTLSRWLEMIRADLDLMLKPYWKGN